MVSWKCNRCGKEFKTREYLRGHRRKEMTLKKYSKGSLGGLVLGIIIMFLCVFIVSISSTVLSGFGQDSIDILNMLSLFIGIIAIFFGVRK